MFKRFVFLYITIIVLGSYSLMGMDLERKAPVIKTSVITEEKAGETLKLGAIMRATLSNRLREIDKQENPELVEKYSRLLQKKDEFFEDIATMLFELDLQGDSPVRAREKLLEYFESFLDIGFPLELLPQLVTDIRNQRNEIITCHICHEDKKRPEMEKLRCGHQKICQTCFMRIIRLARTDITVNLRCPNQSCNVSFFPHATLNPEAKEVKLPNHELTDADIKLLEATTKSCPNLRCRELIERNDGCSHMTCKKCRHQFCWDCLARWTLPHDCQPRIVQGQANEAQGQQLLLLRRYLQAQHAQGTHDLQVRQTRRILTDACLGAMCGAGVIALGILVSMLISMQGR